MRERRQSQRIPLRTWVEDTHENTQYFCHTKDISVGGMFLENTTPYPIGTRIALRFTLPGEREPIDVSGEIVATALMIGERYGMGLRFVDLAPEVRARLESYVARRTQADK